MVLQKSRQAAAAHFFFAFDDKSNVARQLRAGVQVGLDRLEMCQVLAFIVACAAGEKCATLDARLERRRFPKFERFRRLHVVVAIDDEVQAMGGGRRAEGGGQRAGGPSDFRPLTSDLRLPVGQRLVGSFGHNHRVPLSRAEPGFQSNPLAMADDPLCAGLQILAMLWLGRDAGEANILTELVHEARLVLRQVINHRLHQGFLTRKSKEAKASYRKSERLSPTACPINCVIWLALIHKKCMCVRQMHVCATPGSRWFASQPPAATEPHRPPRARHRRSQ